MTTDQMRAGIAAYEHEQRVIARLLRKRGARGLSEREFDMLYRSREWKPGRRLMMAPITGDSFMLGMWGEGLRDQMLDLIKWMIRIGDVNATTINGLVVYSSPGVAVS